MRIALISGVFVEYTIGLANALSKHSDIKVTLILPKNYVKRLPQGSWSTLLGNDVDVRLFRYAELGIRVYLQFVFTVYSLVTYVNRLKPDIIHIQESGDERVCCALPFVAGYPIIHTMHDTETHTGSINPFREIRRKLALKYSDKIIVHGEYLKESALSKFNIKADGIRVIPHGEFSVFETWGQKKDVKEEPNSILFFGSIQKYKGLNYLIRAEPLISKEIPQLKIIIAGSVGRAGSFQSYEKLMVNRDRFECHTHFIPNDMVPELFQRASLIVLPYIQASQSGVIPIAYAFKKPVVVTDVGSIPDVVDNGRTGFVVPPKDSEALADATIKLLKDGALRTEMGENGYQKTKDELSWDEIAEKTITVYREMLGTRKGRG